MGCREGEKPTRHFDFRSVLDTKQGDILKDHHDEEGNTCNPSQQRLRHFQIQIAVVVVDLRGLLRHWVTLFTPEWGLQIDNQSKDASFKSTSSVSQEKKLSKADGSQVFLESLLTLCTPLSKILPFLSWQTRVTKLLTNEVVYMHIMHRCIFAPKHIFQA